MMSLSTLSMTKMPATVVTCVVPPAEEKTGAKAADVCGNGSFHSSVAAAVDSVNIFAGAGVDGSSSSRSGVEQDYLNLPGCRYYPRWCQDVLGLHPDNVFKQLQEAAFGRGPHALSWPYVRQVEIFPRGQFDRQGPDL